MLRISITLLIILLGGVSYSANAVTQSDSIGWKDFSYIKQSDISLTGYNAAGLKYLPVDQISVAEVYANKKDGDFVNYYQSDNSYTLGAQVESFYRLNPKIVFYGKVGYDNFNGKNMGGSAFINPYSNPFDIVEYADSTRGKKNLETYSLIGAVSANVYRGLTLGGKIDYTAANYAKHKDLRHVNKLLDMVVTAGLSYEVNKTIEVGANYYYRRSTEGLEFKMFGTTDKQYNSLISYGAFLGKRETFGEDGYTKKGQEKPMFNEFHGGSLQLNLNLSKKLRLFNEFTYKSREGYYGKDSPGANAVVYSNHNSDIFEYKGMVSFSQDKNQHILKVNVDNESLENFENVYVSEKQEGSSTSIIVYYDPFKVAEKEQSAVSVEYTGNLGIKDFNPIWVLKGGVDFYKRKQTSSVYPYYRKQTIRYTTFNLYANRNILNKKNMYSISLGISYASGSGTEKGDGVYATPGVGQPYPANIDRYVYREYEYLTNKRVKGDIGFKYSRMLDNVGVKGYTAINYSLTKASDIKYLTGDKFNELTLVVGCNF